MENVLGTFCYNKFSIDQILSKEQQILRQCKNIVDQTTCLEFVTFFTRATKVRFLDLFENHDGL